MKILANIGFMMVLLLVTKSADGQGQEWQLSGLGQTGITVSSQKIPDDSVAALSFFRGKVNEWQLQGYLEARLKRLDFSERAAEFHLGKQYEWMSVDVDADDRTFFSPVLSRIALENRQINRQYLFAQVERILMYAENNGYPFASVQLDSVAMDTGKVEARLNIDKGPLVLIDSLMIKGDATISQGFIENYLNIRPGDPYEEKKVRDIRRKLSGLSFLQLKEDPKVYFSNEGARILLLMESVNASRFDFVIGVLPSSPSNDDNLLINGQADLSLVNPFGTGKQLSLHWENPKPRSPVLDINFEYPYLFSMPLGVNYEFDLFKNDTSYLDITHQLGLSWLYGGGNYLKLNFTRKNSNLITINEEAILASGELPEELDMVNTLTGLEWQYQDLDYRFNPLRGWSFQISASAGIREVEANSIILNLSNEAVDFQEKYDSLQAGGALYEGRVDISKFWQVSRTSTILTRGRAAYKHASKLFRNDLYFIGGNQVLRGFDEASVEASFYSMLTLEYRYLIGRNAYFGAFVDGAFVERNTSVSYDKSFPLGVGLNLAFETNAGVFAVSYAIGKRDVDQSFELRSGKIHFGYQNYF